MELRSKFRLIVAEVVAIAVNAIPLGLWLFGDYPAAAAMLIYALESGAAILFSVLCVALVSPASDPNGSSKYKRRSKLIGDFLIISLGMLIACVIFMSAFLFLVLKVSVEVSMVLHGFAIVVGFQVAEFIADLLTLRPMPLRKAELFLTRSMGRTAMLFFGIFIGIFLAAFVDEWFVVPFVVLKTAAEIGEPLKFLLGKEDQGVPLEIG